MKENKGVEGLYQGDILLNQQQEEALKSSKARAAGYRLWPGGVVPYALSSELGKNIKQQKKLALSIFKLPFFPNFNF